MLQSKRLDRLGSRGPVLIARNLGHSRSDCGLDLRLVCGLLRQNEQPDDAGAGVAARDLFLTIHVVADFVDEFDHPGRAAMVHPLAWSRPALGDRLGESILPIAVDALHHIAEETNAKGTAVCYLYT